MQFRNRFLSTFYPTLLVVFLSFFATTFLASAQTISYHDTVLADNPISYWRLGETNGTTLTDQKNKFTGSYVNAPALRQTGAISGDPDTSASFNGSSTYATVPYNSNLNNKTFSVEAWAYPTANNGFGTVISNRNYPYGWNIYVQDQKSGNNWSFWVNNGSNMINVNGPVIQLNKWTHIIGTFDGKTASLYINGKLVTSKIVSLYTPNDRLALTIGKGQPGQSYYFYGRVDDVSLYSTVLTPAQVSKHFLAGTNGTPSPTPTPTPSPSPTPTPIPTSTPSPTPTPTPTPGSIWGNAVVSFTFDDAFASADTIAAPVLSKYGFQATSYANTYLANTGATNYMSWSQIQELQNTYGWEIGNHTYDHPDLTTLTQPAVRSELVNSINDLTAHNIIYPESFATPYGAFNIMVNNEIARLHSSHRTSWNTVNSWPIPTYDLRGMAVDSSISVNTAEGWIDSAIANKQWLILTFHDIVASSPASWQSTTSTLDALAAYVKSKGIPVARVKDVVNSWGQGQNLIQNGSFEIGTATEAANWTRSSPLVSIDSSSIGVYPSPDRSVVIDNSNPSIQTTNITSSIFNIDSTKLYRLKGFFRITNFSSGNIKIDVQEYNSSGALIGTQTIGTLTNSIEPMDNSYFDYTPNSNTASISLSIYTTPNSQMIVGLDGLELKILSN